MDKYFQFIILSNTVTLIRSAFKDWHLIWFQQPDVSQQTFDLTSRWNSRSYVTLRYLVMGDNRTLDKGYPAPVKECVFYLLFSLKFGLSPEKSILFELMKWWPIVQHPVSLRPKISDFRCPSQISNSIPNPSTDSSYEFGSKIAIIPFKLAF